MSSQQDPSVDAWMETEAPKGPGHSTNPVLLVHRALRGRYMLAIAIGAVLAIPGALIGYKLMPPVYTSNGMVTVDPTQQVVLNPNDVNAPITGFDSFVRSQARLLESPRVMQNAATRLARDGVLPGSATDWVMLQRATSVAVPRSSRDMFVSVTMTDPRLAKLSADAILNAFEEIARNEANSAWVDRENALNTIIGRAELDRDAAIKQARDLAASKGTVDLERRRMFVQQQVEELDRRIQELEIEFPVRIEPAAGVAQQAPTRELTPEDLRFDPEMNALLDREQSLRQGMSALRSRVTELHPDFLALRDELDIVKDGISRRMAELKELDLDSAVGSGGVGGFRQRLEALKAIRTARAQEAAELSEIGLRIQALQAEAEKEQKLLDQTRSRLEGLRIERMNATEGRIRVSQQAEFPFRPSEDRRQPLAAMGAFGGMGFSLASFVLYGLLHPRYRYVADLEDEAAAPPVLGLVPQVEDGRIEADEAAQAGIHQIRSLLESVPHSGTARVIVITSATAAEGKSTLAAALAASMARAGRRTLLIDADLIGRGVTSRLSARRLSGLTDRVASRHDNGQIHEVEGRENLDLMPAGIAEGFEAEQLSSQAMEDLLASLRTRYDAVVIDTGPILGSLEANAVVPHTDQVVLVVSRGQNTRLVKVAIDRLHRFHAGRIGLVFNRATRADIERSTSAASISVRSRAYSRPEAKQGSAMSASA